MKLLFFFIFLRSICDRVCVLYLKLKIEMVQFIKKKVKETNNIVGGEFLNCFIPKIT